MNKRLTLFLILFTSVFIVPLHSQYYPAPKVMDKQPVSYGSEYWVWNEQNGSQQLDFNQRYFFMMSQHKSSKFGDSQRIIYQYWNDTDWIQLKELKTYGYNYGLIFWGSRILAEGSYGWKLQDKPMHKGYDLLEYKNGSWDTLPGAVGTPEYYRYFSTDKDLFRLIHNDTAGYYEFYKYDILNKRFNYLAKIAFNNIYEMYVVGGKNRLLIPMVKKVDNQPCHGFAYYENDSLFINSDTSFNDSFFYTIDRADDHIYGYNFRNKSDVIEFTDHFAGLRKASGLEGNGLYGFGVYDGVMYLDQPDYSTARRMVNVLPPGSTKWEQAYGPSSTNSVNGWAIKNNIAMGGYYMYDQDAHKSLRVEKGSRIYGNAYVDIDSNCTWNSGKDLQLNKKLITAGSYNYTTGTYTDSNGNYEFFLAPGTYVLSGPLSPSCPNGINVSGISQQINKDLPLRVPTFIDVSVDCLSPEIRRWFTPAPYKFVINNLGKKTDTVYFEIKLKPGFNITSAAAPVNSFSGNIAKGWIASMNTLDQAEIKLIATIDTGVIKLDTKACHSFTAFAIGKDKDSSNNSKDFCQRIVYSFDPNYKTSNRETIYKDSKTEFDYTIEFQNEGTSYAEHVILEDRLDKAFDISTFKVLGASHAYSYSINANLLRVTFSGINLPEKSSDEEGSKGFFKYSINTNKKLNTDTVILNTASIIFDQNYPIVTNTVSTSVTVPPQVSRFFPDNLVVTGVQYFPLISEPEGYHVRYYRDSVTFDSINGNNEFYTVEKRTSDYDSIIKFHLRVNDKRVYFTGIVKYGQRFLVSDKLIFDYNYKVGESFTVKLNNDTSMDIRLKVDSIKMFVFEDGIERPVHYYTKTPNTNHVSGDPFYSVEGLGSNLGISYLKTEFFPDFGDEWISACVPNQLIYGNPECYVGLYRIKPSCDEDSVWLEVKHAQEAGTDKQDINVYLNIYPNPANGYVIINTSLNGQFSIMDQTGKMCIKNIPFSEGTNTIDINALKSGLYLVYVQSGDFTAVKKISVINNQ